MATFQHKRDPMRLMWRRVGAVVLLIIVALAVQGVWGVYQKEQESEQLRLEAQAKLDDLQKRELELRGNIANLKSDRGIEATLRERYNLAAAGESMVVIIDPPAPSPQPQPTPFQRFKSMFSW